MSVKNYIRDRFPGFVLWTHKLRGVLAYYLNGMPSKRLKVIGITGTNGKTTTCHLTAKILEESNQRVGMLSTTTFKIADDEWVNKTNMTSMSPFKTQSLLKQMVKAGCSYVVMETSSHAIKQYRNWGIRYIAVGLTNVTHEHLDYHGSFDDYIQTKATLFSRGPKVAVANMDDPNYKKFLIYSAQKHLTYSQEKKADITARKVLPSPDGTIFTLATPTYQETIDLHLPVLLMFQTRFARRRFVMALRFRQLQLKKGLKRLQIFPGD